jgi:threonylcarbamoyladenosine tRNA methylthiotransferase CDKAL1
MNKKVFIEEAGCNRRKLDLNTVRSYLNSNDYELVDNPEVADKILVATCAFKKIEEDESIQRLRHFKKYGSKMVVYGCLPDIARKRYEEFADIPKVAPREIEKIEQYFPGDKKRYSAVAASNLLGRQKRNIFVSIARLIQTKPTLNREFWHRMITNGWDKISNILHPIWTPYYLFACRGCLGKCTYCAIRNAIGALRSKPIATVVSEFQSGVRDGYRDFVILGDDPGCYGIDIGITLPELVEALFTASAEIEKSKKNTDSAQREISFYLHEIHPKFLIPYTDKFLAMERFSSVRSILCPIQSGSDHVLELMQREHTAEQFEEVVKKIRRHQPQIAFHTQLIIGFPGETEENFQETLDCVVRCRFNSVLLHPYAEKGGSASELFSDKIPAEIISKRMREAFKFFKKAGVPAYYKCPKSIY